MLKNATGAIAAWVRQRGVRAYRRVKNACRSRWVAHELPSWEERRADIIRTGRERSGSQVGTLGLTPRQIGTLEASARCGGVGVVARVDQDGYWQSYVGFISGVPLVSDSRFLKRTKFDVDVVWTPDYFGIRKRYRGDYMAFLNELSTLDRLGRMGMRVPAILDIDFQAPSLVVSYIPGRVLREALVQAGAAIRDRDQGRWSKGGRRTDAAVKAGIAMLPHVVSTEFIAEMEQDVQRFHDAGLMILDIKWGNIVIGQDGRPWWLDFDMAEDHSELAREYFDVLAELDHQRFTKMFGTTYQPPRAKLCA